MSLSDLFIKHLNLILAVLLNIKSAVSKFNGKKLHILLHLFRACFKLKMSNLGLTNSKPLRIYNIYIYIYNRKQEI